MKIWVFLLLCHTSSAVKHSLTFFTTVSNGVKNLPDSVLTTGIDEIQVEHFDVNVNRRSDSVLWKNITDAEPSVWFTEPNIKTLINVLKNILNKLKQLNPNDAVHVLQVMNSCEWEEESGNISSFSHYGYNAEDFMKLDLRNGTWTVQNQWAGVYKPEEDFTEAETRNIQYFLTQTCPEWLKKFVINSRLQKTAPPSVFFLQKTPACPITCYTTGFYPISALIFWRRDGEELHEDVNRGEVRYNNDGTFQMSIGLRASSVSPGDWERYDCVFQFSGEGNSRRIITRLKKAAIRNNQVSSSELPGGAAVGIVVLILVLMVICTAGVFMCKKKRRGY